LWIYTPPNGKGSKPLLKEFAATRPNPNLKFQREGREEEYLTWANHVVAPPRLLRRRCNNATFDYNYADERIHLKFSIEGSISSTNPLSKDDMQYTPVQLFNRGVTDEQWQSYVKKLCAVNKMRSGYWCNYIPSSLAIMNWDNALRRWQNEFNEECLIPLGLFCKTQSNALLFCCKNLRHTARWITFALTPEAAATLRAEPHLMGEIDNFRSKYCGAYPESQCCVHYRGLEWKSDFENPGYYPYLNPSMNHEKLF